MKFTKLLGLLVVIAIITLSFAMFSSAAETKAAVQSEKGGGAAIYFGMTVLAAGIGIALATLGTGLGQGIAVSKAVEGIARQPEAASTIQTVMIIGLAFIESLTIYALLVALILLFVNPFTQYIVK